MTCLSSHGTGTPQSNVEREIDRSCRPCSTKLRSARWIAGRVLRPVHAMTAKARRLSEKTLHERIASSGPGGTTS
ncbi:hypothetical protein SBADM41S_11358 [Streptomyces badius]